MLVIHPSSYCDVCLEGFSWEADMSPYAIPCGHVFCKTCLEAVQPTRCPLCRKMFNPTSAKKLHVDRPEGEDDPREVDLLQKIALGFDGTEHFRLALIGEVDTYLAAREADAAQPLRKARVAIEKLQKYKRLGIEGKREVTRLKQELRESDRSERANKDRAKEIEDALLLHNRELQGQLVTAMGEIEHLRAEIHRRTQLKNPLPAPPEPVSLDRYAGFRSNDSQPQWYSDHGRPMYLPTGAERPLPTNGTPYHRPRSLLPTDEAERDRKGKGRAKIAESSTEVHRRSQRPKTAGIIPGASPKSIFIPPDPEEQASPTKAGRRHTNRSADVPSTSRSVPEASESDSDQERRERRERRRRREEHRERRHQRQQERERREESGHGRVRLEVPAPAPEIAQPTPLTPARVLEIQEAADDLAGQLTPDSINSQAPSIADSWGEVHTPAPPTPAAASLSVTPHSLIPNLRGLPHVPIVPLDTAAAHSSGQPVPTPLILEPETETEPEESGTESETEGETETETETESLVLPTPTAPSPPPPESSRPRQRRSQTAGPTFPQQSWSSHPASAPPVQAPGSRHTQALSIPITDIYQNPTVAHNPLPSAIRSASAAVPDSRNRQSSSRNDHHRNRRETQHRSRHSTSQLPVPQNEAGRESRSRRVSFTAAPHMNINPSSSSLSLPLTGFNGSAAQELNAITDAGYHADIPSSGNALGLAISNLDREYAAVNRTGHGLVIIQHPRPVPSSTAFLRSFSHNIVGGGTPEAVG